MASDDPPPNPAPKGTPLVQMDERTADRVLTGHGPISPQRQIIVRRTVHCDAAARQLHYSIRTFEHLYGVAKIGNGHHSRLYIVITVRTTTNYVQAYIYLTGAV